MRTGFGNFFRKKKKKVFEKNIKVFKKIKIKRILEKKCSNALGLHKTI